jgi:hypothetical protein
MRSVPKLVEKAGHPDNNRSDTDPDAKRRTLADDNPADASADYPERNETGEDRVDHALPLGHDADSLAQKPPAHPPMASLKIFRRQR